MQGIVPFLQRKKKTLHYKRPHNDGKMDVNISASLIISDVTLGKPQLSEWFICQALEGFTPINGLSGECSNEQWREAQGWEQTEESFICFPGILFVFDCWGEIFISNKEITERDTEAVGCFCFVFLYMSFSLVPNSEIECVALRGEAEGEVLLTSPVISLVLYFFGVQKPCRDIIMREFTRRDLAKDQPRARAKSGFAAHSRHCEGEMLRAQGSFWREDTGDYLW